MYEVFESLITEKGITASDVAKATGLNRQLFTDWKHGRSHPKGDKIAILAAYFKIPMEEFYQGTRKGENNA